MKTKGDVYEEARDETLSEFKEFHTSCFVLQLFAQFDLTTALSFFLTVVIFNHLSYL